MTHVWQKILRNCSLISFFCFSFINITLAAQANNEGIQTYQRNVHLLPEHKQRLANDINRYYSAPNIWDLMRRDFALAHYENHPAVQQKIDWFMNHQDYLLHSMTRAAPFLYFILQQTKKRHLPAELALLPIIESAYNPFALNASSGAAGMWQMMSATAAGYGLRQNGWYDGRRDAITSTKAALNHLAYLKSFFEGNWLLAIAAYDTGEGNVLAAIRRNINHGENTDFWSLPVARETRDYVPQLLALAVIVSHPDRYPITYPEVKSAPYLAQVDIGTQLDLRDAAYLAGLTFKELKQLNSGYNRFAMDPNGPYQIILPLENVEQFTENLAQASPYHHSLLPHYNNKTNEPFTTMAQKKSHRYANLFADNHKQKNTHSLITPQAIPLLDQTETGNVSEFENEKSAALNETNSTEMAATLSSAFQPQHYSMQPGDTLYMIRSGDDLTKIAQHFHVEAKTLASINQIDASNPIRQGQKIIVPTHTTIAQQNSPQKYALTPGDTIYMVRPGDTIERIAMRFHTTPDAVRLANLLANNQLEAGDQLVIPTHV